MADWTAPDLVPNAIATERFLTRLDEDAPAWTFQAFDDARERKDPSLTRVLHGSLDEHLGALTELNRRGAGIFVTVNETDFRGRKRENIVRVRAVWQEDDGEGAKLPIEPHLVVETSPSKFHRYLIVDGLGLDEHRAVQEVLTERYGSDPSAKDLSRVLRLPGFFHQKGEPHLVRIVEESHAQAYSREAILQIFQPASSPPLTPAPVRGNRIPEGNRNAHLTSLAGTMRRPGMTEEAIAAGLKAENELRCNPPLDVSEVEGIARSVARYAPEDDPTARHATVERAVQAVADGDAGAPFAPDVLDCLAALKKKDRAAFEAFRGQLKRAGCRVTALDEAVADASGEPGGRRPTHADVLLGLAADADLFHTVDGTGYADLEIHGHRETWIIRSKGFRRWLARRFFEATDGAPSSEALQSALNVIEARAHFDAPQADVHIRVAGHDGKLYLDLTDEAWRVVEIDADGWRIVDAAPVRFRRAAGMQRLPEPARGGSIEALRSFLNVGSDQDFVLVVAWALAVLRNKGPYPVIVLSGEQGSAKSTFSAVLRALLDPNSAPLRALPREDRDLFIAATNSHVLTFDNVSGLQAWISDTLCRLATGGGFSVRQLYTDQDEILFDAARPVVLNGIEDIVTRPDLADRAIFLTLDPIPEERRRPEKDLWTAFEKVCPQIIGALLDAVSLGLRRLPGIKLDRLPRMADFALWATACETALWPPGTFQAAYFGNLDDAIDSVIDADPVGSTIRAMMTKRTEWTGTASNLLGALDDEVGEKLRKAKTWPATPRALSGRLRRAATFLRKVGIDIEFDRVGRTRTRTIRITSRPESGLPGPSTPSAPSANASKPLGGNGIGRAETRTVTVPADAKAKEAEPSTVRAGSPEINGLDGVDGADAKIPIHSKSGKTTL